MRFIDTEQTRGALSFDAVIPALREAFRDGATVPPRHVHAIESGNAHGTSLIMPAWNERGYFGVKIINIFPENTHQGLPGLHERVAEVARFLKSKYGLAVEVVYVDDGSRDGSSEVALTLPASSLDVQVVTLSRNCSMPARLPEALVPEASTLSGTLSM